MKPNPAEFKYLTDVIADYGKKIGSRTEDEGKSFFGQTERFYLPHKDGPRPQVFYTAVVDSGRQDTHFAHRQLFDGLCEPRYVLVGQREKAGAIHLDMKVIGMARMPFSVFELLFAADCLYDDYLHDITKLKRFRKGTT